MKKIILIPAYKPDSTLTDLVSALSSHGLSVVVVDDGSGEKYRAVFSKRGSRISAIIFHRPIS